MQESSLVGDAAVLDLAACAREPIHAPGALQPHGILRAPRGLSSILRQASANAYGLSGRAAFGQSDGMVRRMRFPLR